MKMIDVYLETGQKRTIAGALDWPGWCRIGRDEASALDALFKYASRYAQVVEPAGMDFHLPKDPAAFSIVERLTGDSGTDYGVPSIAPSVDKQPVDRPELDRLEMLLKACWQAFDAASMSALGKELRKGPRGGGRSHEAIVDHVVGAEAAYLGMLGMKFKLKSTPDLVEPSSLILGAVLEGMEASVRGELPATGPRGGKHWLLHYYVRRSAWHILDHAWEIEDRII